MSSNTIPVRDVSSLECRTCGAGAPVDEHFCPNCSRILALGRHGDYFSFLGLPRALTIETADLDRRYRELSRKFHPDFYYNATPTERLASLERSSYLNDAVRTLRNPVTRIEHLLAIEGLPSAGVDTRAAGVHGPGTGGAAASGAVPPSLLEEVFALNEELDEIRELRESGRSPQELAPWIAAAREPIESRRVAHEAQLQDLSARWDAVRETGSPDEKRAILEALRERLLERNYINNLLATIDRESAHTGSDG
jgi:curved DNA-binding protein CbpA